MEKFRPDNRERFGDRGKSGRGRFGGRWGFRDRDSGRSDRRPLEMHEATCDKCGKRCEVPFKPTGNKPVFAVIVLEKMKAQAVILVQETKIGHLNQECLQTN